MAVDITTIGIEYDTSGLEKGTRAQDKATDSAVKMAGAFQDAAGRWRAASGRFLTDVEKTGLGIETLGKSVSKTEQKFGSFNKILGLAATALAAVGGVMLAKKFVETADAVSLMDARLKLATGTLKEFGQAQKDIYSIAQANNVGLMETAQLYTKLSDPVKRLGGTTREVNAIVSAFATSMRVGGASAQEASSATLQFAQAMGSGKLQGDEFRSLAEASPRFMKALAEGMKMPIEKLKEMGTDGKLTADVVGNALISSLAKLKKEAESLPDTVSGAITRFKNDIIVAVGEINKTEGFTAGFAGLIESARGFIPVIRDELKAAFEAVSGWVDRNREGLSEVWDNAKGLLGEVWELAKSAASVVGFITEWAVQSGTVKTVFESIRFLVAGFQDGVTIIGAGFATMGSKIFQFVLEPLQKVLEMSAKIAGVFDEELAGKIRGVGTEIDGFAKSGEQYGASVVAAFERGDSAVGRLNKSLETSGKETKTATKEAKAAAETYTSLHGGVEKAAKGATTASLAASASRKAAHKAEIDLLKDLIKDFKEFDREISAHTKKTVADIIGGIQDQDKNYLSAKKSMDAYAQGMSEANELAELEIQLLGASAVERNTIIEQKKIEFKLEKQLADIRSSNMLLSQKNDLIDQANAQAMIDQASAGLRAQQTEYTKFFGEIYNGLSDSLYRGFESGKGFGRSFMDSLKNLFKTNVIKIAVQAVMGTGSSLVSSIAGGSGGGASSLLSMGKSLWDGFSLAGTVGGGIGQLGGYLGSTTLSAFASGMSGTAAGTFAGMGPTVAGSTTGLGALAGTGGTTGVLSSGAGAGSAAAGAGSSAAAALPIIGWIAAGMMANNSLFDKGWGGKASDGTKHAGIASGMIGGAFENTIQKMFGLSDKTASMLSGSAVVNRLFGHKTPELQQSELSGSFGAEGYSASTRDVYKQKGGVFRGDKWSENVTKSDSSAMTEAFTAVKDAAKGYASVLGLSTAALDTFTKDFKINLSITGDVAKDAEANQKIMTDLLSGVTNDLSNLLAPSLMGFSKQGETASATLQRLATGLASVNEIMTAVGFDKFAQSLEGANASQRLLDLTGGIEKLASGAQYFFENFLTDAEKIKPSVDLVSSTMSKLGQSSVDTVEEFKTLVQGLDLSTQAGAEMYASLIAIAPQFKAVADYTEATTAALADAAEATRIANETMTQRKSLQDEYNALTMTSAQLSQLQRDALFESNRGLFDSIQAIKAKTEADRIAEEQTKAASEIARQQRALDIELMRALGNEEGALAATRADALAALPASVRATQMQIWAANDASAALAKASQSAAESLALVAKAQQDAERAQQEAQQAYDKRLSDARAQVTKSFQAEMQVWSDVASKAAASFSAARQAQSSLRFGASSAYNTSQQYGLAKSMLPETISKARLGDVESIGKLQQFVDLSKNSASSFGDYLQDFAVVMNVLEDTASTAETQERIAKNQLDTMKRQLDTLTQVDNSVLSVGDAIRQLEAVMALGLNGVAQAAFGQYSANAPKTSATASTGLTADQIYGGLPGEGDMQQKRIAALAKNARDTATVEAYINAQDNSGQMSRAWQDQMWSAENYASVARQLGLFADPNLPTASRLPSFDVGTGFVPQDMTARIHRGEMITPARFNPNSDSNIAAMNLLVERLSEKIGKLVFPLEAIAGHTAATKNILIRLTPSGDSIQVSVAEDTPLRVEVV